MTRDFVNSQQRPSKSAPNYFNQQQHQHQHQHQQSFNNNNNNAHQFHHANNHHKIVQFEPFCLISQDDKSLKQAAELVESASLNRFKVCVVTIISKEALGGSVKDTLVQAALNSSSNGANKRRSNGNNNRFQQQQQRGQTTKPSQSNETSSTTAQQTKSLVEELLTLNSYENQVVGQIDSQADVIVLNLTSFLEADKVCLLSETIDELFETNPVQIEDRLRQSFILKSWPKWNQNLVKTLLILFLMSHIIVFYNPEPSIDYNLINLLKILEALRLKSQNRITDLLETIASNQMFPQQWIRQGRLSCPRALFVCDCSNLDIKINQSDVAAIKRDLEDQIYIILKKTNITCRPLVSASQQNQQALLCLPERDDFVFIMTKQDLPNVTKQQRSHQSNSSAKSRDQRNNQHNKANNDYNNFYEKLFETLQLSCQTNKAKIDCDDALSKKKQSLSSNADDERNSQDEANVDNQAPESTEDGAEVGEATVTNVITPEPPQAPIGFSRYKSTAHQNRFRKFLMRHIADIQSGPAQVVDGQNNNGKHSNGKHNILLPRYDDFFTILLRLKSLLFPMQSASIQQTNSNETTANEIQVSASSCSHQHDHPEYRNIWTLPDERRFVDIYDLFNSDELFSKHHCHKARAAAFDYFSRLIVAPQGKNASVTWPSVKEFYLKHARGPACLNNLKLLEEQCNKFRLNIGISVEGVCSSNDLVSGPRFAKLPGNRLARAKSSDLPNASLALPPNLLQPDNSMNYQQQRILTKQPSLLITRRNNGIKMTSSCDCGRQSNFIIAPVDRKKKLERVDIHKLND